MRMKRQSDKSSISNEIIAAYLDGNATPAEVQLVLDAMAHDTHLRELMHISSCVDTELALLQRKSNYLPMAALAADCGEDNLCCLECEKFVMQRRGIHYDEQQLVDTAIRNGWLKPDGTALHNVGRHLETAGLIASRQYNATLQDIHAALQQGKDVIVAIDGNELHDNQLSARSRDMYIGLSPNHTIVVLCCNIEENTITIFDPNSPKKQDCYRIPQFLEAWSDSQNYVVFISDFIDTNAYSPKPIDVSDVVLDADLDELREAIAENAHDIWAAERMQDGWTYGPERNDELKHNPCMVPYSQLPESEKEYDRKMAMQTIKLMKKLGYDIIKREE